MKPNELEQEVHDILFCKNLSRKQALHRINVLSELILKDGQLDDLDTQINLTTLKTAISYIIDTAMEKGG